MGKLCVVGRDMMFDDDRNPPAFVPFFTCCIRLFVQTTSRNFWDGVSTSHISMSAPVSRFAWGLLEHVQAHWFLHQYLSFVRPSLWSISYFKGVIFVRRIRYHRNSAAGIAWQGNIRKQIGRTDTEPLRCTTNLSRIRYANNSQELSFRGAPPFRVNLI